MKAAASAVAAVASKLDEKSDALAIYWWRWLNDRKFEVGVKEIGGDSITEACHSM